MANRNVHERTENNVREDGTLVFLDSVFFLPCSLRKLPEAFDITASKSWYPHYFNTEENLDYVGPIPDALYYGANEMSEVDEEILKRHPDLKTHPVVLHSPLNTRDALYGGRTEAMRLHYKIREGEETVQYVDVMILYPYICKYFKFPVGHPVIHVGDAYQDAEAMLRKEGLIKCCVLPPQSLYYPVLTFRCNDRLLFCLCKSCANERNSDGECADETVAEWALIGTWVIDKVRLAVQKSYEVIEIFEVYEHAVTQYDPQTGQGVLFVEYVDTFLKLKTEAIRYPD